MSTGSPDGQKPFPPLPSLLNLWLISGWISRYGVPSTIILNRGRQFESNLWGSLMSLLGTKRARTTAYHPQANSMVERFHRQLKAALKTQTDPAHWVDALPLVLLGIRTAFKENISATAAEMVYGTSLRFPGEFFSPPSNTVLDDPSNFVHQLKSHMQQIRPLPPRPAHSNSQDLATTTHVFIRQDAVRKPLQPPYNGPYPVVSRTDKHFTIKVNGRQDTISVDRLKPAHLDDIPERLLHTVNSPIERVTRSGSQVHWPKHLSSYVS